MWVLLDGPALPRVAVPVELEEHAVVRVLDADGALALVDDDVHGVQRRVEILHHCHFAVIEFVAGELHVSVVVEEIWMSGCNGFEACQGQSVSRFVIG